MVGVRGQESLGTRRDFYITWWSVRGLGRRLKSGLKGGSAVLAVCNVLSIFSSIHLISLSIPSRMPVALSFAALAAFSFSAAYAQQSTFPATALASKHFSYPTGIVCSESEFNIHF